MKTKSKITAAVVGLLSVVALAGTGYAGWVISQNASDKGEGGMIAYDIKDNGVQVSKPAWKDNKDKIIWGLPTQDVQSDAWFNSDGKDNREKEFFSPVLTFTVTNNDSNDKTKPVVEAKITVKDNSSNSYNDCLTKEIIKGVPVSSAEKELTANTATTDASSYDYTIDLSGEFGWGAHIGSKNPYEYYNGNDANGEKITAITELPTTDFTKINDSDTTYFDDAKSVMTAVYGLKDVTFTISITVSHGVSSN